MAERQWTPQQKDAIEARGGTLLLSAAAGSGKTAVLVERIITLLTQENNPVEPCELLVATFTNAAAAEMRMRISAAVDELIKNDPASNRYRLIKMKLPEAQISTIDSFCIKLVRENFHSADIEPDFTLLNSCEEQIIVSEAMSQTLDTLCTADPDVYDMLNSMTSYGGDDSKLSDKIIKLYNYSLAHPFPDEWLSAIADMYKPCEDVKNSVWGRIITDDITRCAEYCKSLCSSAVSDSLDDEKIRNVYYDPLCAAYNFFCNLCDVVSNGSWDDIYRFINESSLSSGLPRVPGGYGDNPAKVSALYKYKKAVSGFDGIKSAVCTDTKGFNEDCEQQRPVINALVGAVRIFAHNCNELKKEKNGYNFSDIMHKALDLLVKTDENGRTFADTLKDRYREILIDEYQDTNEAQDMLFRLISKDESNMFMVGDVKQSIYRFRLAMPEIFMKKSNEFHAYDGSNYPAKIILGRNFRSRKGVLDNINHLFYRIMSESAGEMDYTADDALYYGKGYDEDTAPCVELHFADCENTDEEAVYVANLIDNMIKSGTTVYSKGVQRPARAGDFCILMRSPGKKGAKYAEALNCVGIKSTLQQKSSLFDSVEVSVFMSLLKVISNPTDDVSMLAVMFSPVYGFTPDEAAEMKINDRRLNMYTCLKKVSKQNPKAQKLLSDLLEYRKMAAVMPFDVFVRTLMDITGYLAVVGSMGDGALRRTNLMMLSSLAVEYVSSGLTGIDGFVRYVNRLAESGTDNPAASDVSDTANVVRIYSIHKSKGLEFPFVILADCAKAVNLTDARDEMIISDTAGVGMVIINNDKLQKYSSLGHTAAKINMRNATVSEELRVLYVAMTRAKERLIAVSSDPKIEETIQKVCYEVPAEGAVPPEAVLKASTYEKWFIMGYLNHPDMRKFINNASYDVQYSQDESPLKIVSQGVEYSEDVTAEQTEETANEELVAQIKEKCEFVYPYILPEDARPKRVASDFENHIFKPEYFAKSKPSFILGDKLNPAEVGTANHLYLQNLDFASTDVTAECVRMENAHILNKKQAESIRLDKMEKFINSTLFSRIKNADKVYRELEFTAQVRLGDVNPDAADNVKDEKILVLGKADLVFVENGAAVVVDYKTDRSKTEDEFVTAYSGQLDMYRRAMEQILEMPVKEAVIYSLELEKEIAI
ncbi:MAG: helicase-exonuclease AddAB subunit AddA [Clostridia bacterium]|nr:helicase-exonuclease AddAB subunit AddA [Clostridia bacterium]